MAKTNTKNPFRVTLSPERRNEFKIWLVDQLQNAINARSRVMDDGGLIDTWHGLYEQAERPRNLKAWDGAADLASWIPTEKVDAMRARLVSVVFGVDPICVVEGWGEKATDAAKVEAFHQWKAEDEKLQRWVAKAIHKSLIEGNGILEVTERAVLRKTQTMRTLKMRTDEFGAPMLDAEGQPVPEVDEAGLFVDETEAGRPAVTAKVEAVEDVNAGPRYRVLSLKDFMFLPGHARDESELWGYAKRVYVRLPTLKQRAKQGIYDLEAVERLGTDGDRQTRQEHLRANVDVAPQEGQTAEKELWEVHLLHDIDDDGIDEWLIATVSLQGTELLRLDYDDLGQVQYVNFCPYPSDDSIYGFSYVGHKLWTVTEEHTALRNMKADRSALATNAPIKRLATAYWDPDEEPWGAGGTITVRDMNEVQPMQVQDVPNSVIESERSTLAAAERLSGQNDTAISGVKPEAARTATEISTTAHASFVRIEEIVHWIQEAMEDLYQLRHVLYERQLKKEEGGLAPPASVLQGLESRGLNIPKDGPFKFTADDLAGTWRFKPRGSVETADIYRMRSDFAESLQALGAIGKTFPQLGQMLANTPDAWQTILEQWARLYKMTDLEMALKQAMQQQAMQPAPAPGGMPTPGGAPGLPPGLPPWLGEAMQGMTAGGPPPAETPGAPGIPPPTAPGLPPGMGGQ